MKSTVFFTVISSAAESRSDDTLLTGGFNRRNTEQRTQRHSRVATTLEDGNVPSLRDCAEHSSCSPRRRLKSTVNKVSSLRDCFADIFVHSPAANKQITPNLFIRQRRTYILPPSLFIRQRRTSNLLQVCSFASGEHANSLRLCSLFIKKQTNQHEKI